ncbi:MAG: NAD(P)/FAD-dependent oxidoreductase [Tepidisphaeraceae bacterium]
MPSTPPDTAALGPRVFIVGGGFAGLEAAKALAKTNCRVTLVDRRNHHVFQPLLYQVATASLSPAEIAAPIRHILRKQRNCRVVLAEMVGVDVARKHLLFRGGAVEYDYLILAAGATHSYFGRDDFAALAPGLKSIEDATEMRKRILLAFESAEYEGSEARRRAALTFAIVGGGPTGVELAGAIKEIAAKSIPADFRQIDTTTTRVILLQGGDRLLPQMPPELSEHAKRDLEAMGVEVRLNARVTDVTKDGVKIGEEFVPVRNVFWAAGVQGNPIGRTLGVPLDRSGRVQVGSDCSIPGHPEVFVVGDLAAMLSADTQQPVPGVAQGAIQMGRYVGRLIAGEIAGSSTPTDRKPFSYYDKGILATIGRNRAVGVLFKNRQVTGFIAWLLWGLIHIAFLIGFRNRLAVMTNWVWNWLLNARDARLITGDARIDVAEPRPGEVILANEGQASGTLTPPSQPAAASSGSSSVTA